MWSCGVGELYSCELVVLWSCGCGVTELWSCVGV